LDRVSGGADRYFEQLFGAGCSAPEAKPRNERSVKAANGRHGDLTFEQTSLTSLCV
jgi:hypothetical protein